jgi:hypothetical protein
LDGDAGEGITLQLPVEVDFEVQEAILRVLSTE